MKWILIVVMFLFCSCEVHCGPNPEKYIFDILESNGFEDVNNRPWCGGSLCPDEIFGYTSVVNVSKDGRRFRMKLCCSELRKKCFDIEDGTIYSIKLEKQF